jgi:hypothetical protein
MMEAVIGVEEFLEKIGKRVVDTLRPRRGRTQK